MAIRTNWHKISYRINHIFPADFADWFDMMHFDFPGEFLAKGNTEVKSAQLTSRTMHGNTASACLRIALILILQNCFLRAFHIDFIRKFIFADEFMLILRKRPHLMLRIFLPHSKFCFKPCNFKCQDLIQHLSQRIDISCFFTDVPSG